MVWTSPHVPIHPVIPVVLNSAKFCCKSKTEYPIATTTQKKGLNFFFLCKYTQENLEVSLAINF